MDSLLEWSETPNRVDTHNVGPCGLYYRLNRLTGTERWRARGGRSPNCVLSGNITFKGDFNTLEDAKAACEADFARRLMEVPAVKELVAASTECLDASVALTNTFHDQTAEAPIKHDALERYSSSGKRLAQAVRTWRAECPTST